MAVLLSGCAAGSATPRTLPSVHQPSPQASSVAPRESVASLKAFVRQYYAEIGVAASTGNVTALNAMIAPGCPCDRLTAFIRRARKQGHIVGFAYKIQRVYDAAVQGGSGTAVVLYSVPAARLVGPAGAVLASEAPESNQTVIITALWITDRWLISNVVTAPSGG